MSEEENISHAEELLVYLITQIVDDKDSVEIEIEESDTKLSMVARVANGDMGRVIGKRGRVANSIRDLVRAAAFKDGIEVEVDFDG
ncbi:MAG: KH domain-containing protein [Actinomycetia bacterium]|nr:KH domain-containing protein [Actinomycetes bacterium]MCP4959085.1 KH domain-containing protein [Actinomycetes bacterium]